MKSELTIFEDYKIRRIYQKIVIYEINGIVLWEPSNPDSTFEETLIKKMGFTYTNWGNQIILNPKMVKEWLKGHKTRASVALVKISKEKPQLFAHWKMGVFGAFS